MAAEDNSSVRCSIPFASPVTVGLFGPTLCGKSSWCKRLIENSNSMFTQPVEGILYSYGMYQNMFDELALLPNLQLHAGLPNKEDLYEFTSNKNHCLIILYDLQLEMRYRSTY